MQRFLNKQFLFFPTKRIRYLRMCFPQNFLFEMLHSLYKRIFAVFVMLGVYIQVVYVYIAKKKRIWSESDFEFRFRYKSYI